MKRFRLLILTLLMVLTLLPFSTYADEDTTSKKPDSTVYASDSDLKSNEMYGSPLFQKAKILFGKDSYGNRLEWYLSGVDSSLSNPDYNGNNILIISITPIAELKFNPNEENSTYVYEADTGYGNTAGSIEVYANHYGNSELRKSLQSIASNTAYFSMAEQNMMLSVPIVTEDNKNQTDGKNIEYTTSDKLYIPSYKQDESNEYISYGSKNKKVVGLDKLDELFSTPKFFLRTPCINGQSQGIYMCAREGVRSNYVIGTASPSVYADSVIVADLKADNILFASSAETETAKINKNKAMTLRFKDENIDIGKVVYTTDGVIFVERGNTDKKVNLIVQGKNGEENWSYSKEITGDTVINKSEIIEELKKISLNIADIDLKKCYIWLEITNDDGLIYANKSLIGINNVEITDINAPVSGKDLDISATCKREGVINDTHTVTWGTTDTKAGYHKVYTASITLECNTLIYKFTDNIKITVNGQDAEGVINNDGSLTVTYAFPRTNDKLVSAADPDPITVKNGIALNDMPLPDKVTVETIGKSTTSLEVDWFLDEITDYDPDNKAGRELTIRGIVILPENILDINNDMPTVVTIKVNVQATSSADNKPAIVVPDTSVK